MTHLSQEHVEVLRKKRAISRAQFAEWHVLNVDQLGLDVGMGLIHSGATFRRDVILAVST
jgi:hypothetical protein